MLQDLSLGNHQKEVPLLSSFLKIKYEDINFTCQLAYLRSQTLALISEASWLHKGDSEIMFQHAFTCTTTGIKGTNP